MKRNTLALAALFLALFLLPLAAYAVPADSDYQTDETFVFVEERSAQALGMINEILCMIGQAGFVDMVNYDADGDGYVDPYKAQIDANLCSQDRDSASQGGQGAQNQTSGANQPNYELWTVKSYRAGPEEPHYVECWITQEGDEWMPPQRIRALVVITQSPTDEDPLGQFSLNFALYGVDAQGNVAGEPVGQGLLQTAVDADGNKILEFAQDMEMGGFSMNEKVALLRDGESGSGSTYVHESEGGAADRQDEQFEHTSEFDFVYNSNWFLRQDQDGQQTCLDRNNFREHVWRYGLYNSETGARIERNSGFPIKYVEGSEDWYGWIGYWGIWFPEEVSLEDENEVFKLNFGPEGDEVGQTYTVFKRGGKLIRHDRQELTLGQLQGAALQYFAYDSATDSGMEYRVAWNGQAFEIRAVLEETAEGPVWSEPAAGQDVLDLSALDWPELSLWSQERGASVRVRFQNCQEQGGQNEPPAWDCTNSAGADTPVIMYNEEVVFPGDTVPEDLVCFEQCPQPVAAAGDPLYYDGFANWEKSYQNAPPDQSNYIAYKWAGLDHVLTDANGNAVVHNFEQQAGGMEYWGTHSGSLISLSDLDQLACEGPNGPDSATCAWNAWNVQTFYTWETGSNSWNQFSTLTDQSGQYLEFDQPLTVKYEPADGPTAFLEYAGFGELHGIPGHCVNWDGEVVSCDQEEVRWVPEYAIEAGELVTLVGNPEGFSAGQQFLVKPLEMEKQMIKDPNGCPGMTVAPLELPTLDEWQNPGIGEQPAIEAGPIVINGVVQQ